MEDREPTGHKRPAKHGEPKAAKVDGGIPVVGIEPTIIGEIPPHASDEVIAFVSGIFLDVVDNPESEEAALRLKTYKTCLGIDARRGTTTVDHGKRRHREGYYDNGKFPHLSKREKDDVLNGYIIGEFAQTRIFDVVGARVESALYEANHRAKKKHGKGK
jgi:hypothetical protein